MHYPLTIFRIAKQDAPKDGSVRVFRIMSERGVVNYSSKPSSQSVIESRRRLPSHFFRRPMAYQPKPWHQAEHYQHAQVNGARNFVTAAQEVGKRLMLKNNRKAKLRKDCKSKCQKPGNQGVIMLLNLRESSEYVPRGKEDGGCHDWHFRQFRPAFSDTWNH